MKYYFTYQTKNLINGKTYIGVHTATNPNDTYIGHGIYRQSDAERMKRSGSRSLLVQAVCKYGYENFRREILCFFDSKEEALEEEAWLITDEYRKDTNNYNTCTGGLCGDTPITEEHLETLRDLSSKEYVVANLITREYWVVKNLTQFERERFEEFGHENTTKRLISKLSSVSRGKSRVYKRKWWACKKENWDGIIPTIEDLNKTKQWNGFIPKTVSDAVIASNKRRAKEYYFISPIGEVVHVTNLPSFCKENGLDSTCMSRVSNEKIKNHKGWTKYNNK